MTADLEKRTSFKLEQFDPARMFRGLGPAALCEEALRRGEASLAHGGALVATTGEHTGRSPKDRFLVRHPGSEGEIAWGAVNQPLGVDTFDRLQVRVQEYLAGRDLFVFDGYAGADPDHRLRVRVITERAWHCLFAWNMFLREAEPAALERFEPDFTVVSTPGLHAEPERDGTRSPTFILLDLDRDLCLIGGTEYAGEIKKSIFGVMNYKLPKRGILSMHCSANYGRDRDDVALFFGLSGTGKTTLSSAPDRTLVGDDEHAWSDSGVFNLEGGCYAKVIRLDPEGEPEIWRTTRRFGTILENVMLDSRTRCLDLDDDTLTENTRASYPLSHLNRVDLAGTAGHPRTIVFLTCDAFGVLPPVARLSEGQAMYHFLSGYTAKVAGTERGVTEPQATFSTCFGAPFMPLRPTRYAEMLGERLRRHQVPVYLINTGWTGGPYGEGRRIPLELTRRIVRAALSGELERAPLRVHPVFGLEMPAALAGLDPQLLDPRTTWRDPAAYDEKARRLAAMFAENFADHQASVSAEILAAAPRV